MLRSEALSRRPDGGDVSWWTQRVIKRREDNVEEKNSPEKKLRSEKNGNYMWVKLGNVEGKIRVKE